MRQTRQAARRKRPPIGGPSSAASAGAGRSHATARAALRRVGPGGPTTPGGIPPERRARRDTPAQAGALPRSLPPADGKKNGVGWERARPLLGCAATLAPLPFPPKAAIYLLRRRRRPPPRPQRARAGLPLCARPRGPARTQPRSGATERPAPKALACNKVEACMKKDGSTLSLSQHSAVVKRCCYAPRCSFAAACPPEPRLPGGDGRGEPCAAAHGFPLCRGFLGGAFAGARSVPGKDRRRPPRCRFPHAAGVGVSSRSTVSRVRRAAPRLLLAAVHRAVLHLGRRCSLWQSSTT